MSNEASKEFVSLQDLFSSNIDGYGQLVLNPVKTKILMSRIDKLRGRVLDLENSLGAIRLMKGDSVYADILGDELDKALPDQPTNEDGTINLDAFRKSKPNSGGNVA